VTTQRIGIKTFTLSRADLERYLIENHDMPEDIVVTNIARPVNQEAWLVNVQSKKFATADDLSMWPTQRNDLLIRKAG
jgi:hypothetical protein